MITLKGKTETYKVYSLQFGVSFLVPSEQVIFFKETAWKPGLWFVCLKSTPL